MTLLKKLGMALAGLGLVSALDLGSRLYARDIHVPRDYVTIQAGIDAAEDGDRVLVSPGEYVVREPITYRGKNIVLKGEEGPEKTIINGKNQTRIFTFSSGETNEAILEWFTIIKGSAYEGGGIYCKDSSPTIRNNFISENQSRAGGAIACIDSAPIILVNYIFKNLAGRSGGGIYCNNSRPIIQDNVIRENFVEDEWGGGIVCLNNTSAIIKENFIIDNFAHEIGGGICLWGSEATIQNNVIAKNHTNENGGGIAGIYSILNVNGNTIAYNTTEYMGGGIHFVHEDNPSYSGFLTALNNIIWNNKGESEISVRGPFLIAYDSISRSEFCGQNNNICADPLFVNPNPDSKTIDNLIEQGDYEGVKNYLRKCYSLKPDSPCIDAGSPDSPPDPDGTRADIGAIYFDQIKNRFVRGDANRDGKVDISDGVAGLYHLFKGRELECRDAADVNDDGKIDIADPIHLLDYLFRDGPLPPEPFPDEGYDFTHDTIGCYIPKLFEDD